MNDETIPILKAEIANSQDMSQEIRLILDQDTFIRSQEDLILISGRLETEKLDSDDTINNSFSGKISYQLENPETKELLICLERSLSEVIFPLDFSDSLELPEDWEIAFLLGEVILESDLGSALCSQSFTITTEVSEAIEEVDSLINYTIELSDADTNSSFKFDLVVTGDSGESHLDVDLPDPKNISKPLQPTSSSSNKILPPKLANSSSSTAKSKKSLQLPKLPSPESVAPEVVSENPDYD